MQECTLHLFIVHHSAHSVLVYDINFDLLYTINKLDVIKARSLLYACNEECM